MRVKSYADVKSGSALLNTGGKRTDLGCTRKKWRETLMHVANDLRFEPNGLAKDKTMNEKQMK